MAYTRVNWENLPSTNTPVNATNLNKMDAGIANAVEKTGDTMTGDLDMQNNSVKFGTTGNILWKEDGYGDKFRIIPDFGNVGANNKLIIQSTNGDAGTDPQNWKDLVTIHADSGQVDLIHPTVWTDATVTSKLKSTGAIRYTKIGNVVIVNFVDIEVNSSIASHADILATGLPNSIIYLVSALFNYVEPSKPIRIAITTDGKIQTHYSNQFTASEPAVFYGTIVYITNQ